ncbi:tRNA (mo5U34)-methyltransferase [Candidatus Phycosocius bacilliformis]|uniref:tRNA (Mo5U34)-methyltransferase n=1 Tax=Candidatus Phycosocius bacilliformis TaxID=1445552 RepID=A0A2P2ED24_9PROT|nr:class I SAM-dependent methyltransferase [Candidatus Phycosocius bacilliformis]GBF58956.1 tRNA (mo5U34)-methyltransferase [Candidatus Phycosocius bacilliformis]
MKLGDKVSAKACLVCGETERTVVGTMGRGLKPLISVLCESCGLVSHDPLPSPEELAAFYAQAYRQSYKGDLKPKAKHSLRAQRSAALRAVRLKSLLSPGARVLDVGASSGEFVYMMGKLGFKACGVEPHDGYRQFGTSTYGIEVTNQRLEPAAFGAGIFDLITLNHVFEHLAEPLAALASFKQWLVPGGLLFIEVPNIEGVQKQRSNLFHYAHVWNFAPPTLIAMLKLAGFEPINSPACNGTSRVFRVANPAAVASLEIDPFLAHKLRDQLLQDQSAMAYLGSGAPFRRRWARLLRNIDELSTTRRFASLPAMADAVLNQALQRAQNLNLSQKIPAHVTAYQPGLTTR